jgi:hypothetical protein
MAPLLPSDIYHNSTQSLDQSHLSVSLPALSLKAGPTGKLAFLNDMVGIFEAEVDFEGNF